MLLCKIYRISESPALITTWQVSQTLWSGGHTRLIWSDYFEYPREPCGYLLLLGGSPQEHGFAPLTLCCIVFSLLPVFLGPSANMSTPTKPSQSKSLDDLRRIPLANRPEPSFEV